MAPAIVDCAHSLGACSTTIQCRCVLWTQWNTDRRMGPPCEEASQ
ncbi:unnamed protein product [Staurois parvus]|uniref:Uncharacterized protein n=1 Tax=Staurois parvus TaxID=386267 RepID=A0ABN9EK52_9NEOB|nr:unnamed protein product [Staurois parvus]